MGSARLACSPYAVTKRALMSSRNAKQMLHHTRNWQRESVIHHFTPTTTSPHHHTHPLTPTHFHTVGQNLGLPCTSLQFRTRGKKKGKGKGKGKISPRKLFLTIQSETISNDVMESVANWECESKLRKRKKRKGIVILVVDISHPGVCLLLELVDDLCSECLEVPAGHRMLREHHAASPAKTVDDGHYLLKKIFWIFSNGIPIKVNLLTSSAILSNSRFSQWRLKSIFEKN